MPTRAEMIAKLEREDTIRVLKEWDAREEDYSALDPEMPEDKPYEFDAFISAANIVPSAANLAWDITYPARHPVNTVTSFVDIGSGLLEKMGLKAETQDTETVNAVAGYLSDRYGSVENALKTLQDDPIGLLSDITGLLHGGGMLVAKAGLYSAGSIANIAKMADPANLMINTGKAGFKSLAGKTDPVGILQSSAKFKTALDEKFGVGERRRLAELLLRNKIGLNYAGTVDLEKMIKGLNSEVDAILRSPQGRAANIPAVPAVTRHIPELRAKYGSTTQADPAKNLAVIDKAVDKWAIPQRAQGDLPWSLSKLQKFKKNMYNQADYNTAPGKKTRIQNETYKALARGAKDAIEEGVPAVKGLNQQLSDLYSLRPALIRSAGRIDNRDLGGIGTPIKAAGGAALGGAIGGDIGAAALAAYGLASGIADTPLIKAKIAQGLFNVQKISYGDIYRSSGDLPTLLRNIATQGGQGALLLDEDQLLSQ